MFPRKQHRFLLKTLLVMDNLLDPTLVSISNATSLGFHVFTGKKATKSETKIIS